MKSNSFRLVVMVLAVAMACGCATIIKGSSADVLVESNPPGADVYIDDEYRGVTPLTVELDQRCGDYAIRMSKQGHDDATGEVTTGFSGWTIWPSFLIIDGLIGNALIGTMCTVDRKRFALLLEGTAAGGKPGTPDKDRSAGGVASPSNWPDLRTPAGGNQGATGDVAVVVGIEDYLMVSDVPGAAANADAWFNWLTDERGLPFENTILLKNQKATDLEIRSALKKAAAMAKSGATVWFIFIGHGAPSKDQKDGVLIGVDAQQTVTGLYGRSLARKDVLEILSKGKQDNTIVLLDSCFSGQGSTGDALVAGLQPLLPITGQIKTDAVILSAGSTDEFAGPLPAGDRPAFSYLMLGALRGWGDADQDGHVTASEALEYTQKTLRATLRGRSQTPSRSGNKASVTLSTASSEKGPALGTIITSQ